MAELETGYQPLHGSHYDEDGDSPPSENMIHMVPDHSKGRFNHIEDLDLFFSRVYQYHQRNGFLCMVLQDVMQLIQFMFVVLFSVFLMQCVDYDILFYEKIYNTSHKVTLDEAVYPLHQCAANLDFIIVVCLIVASVFWCLRVIKIIYHIFKYLEIKGFYNYALKISSEELANMTWHEVQRRLLDVQKEQQMCIHKQELTELDIYHRILRFKNYMIAMVNKSLLPLKYRVPCLGEYAFMSTSLKYNLEMILFWGPWSPFENNWHLKQDYKTYHMRKELADRMSNRIFWVGIANFLLCPLIFLWQILYSFFRYAEVFKNNPSTLGSRRWSLFSRLYLRHFNELDHEFDARLNRAYLPADRYMNIFTSPVIVIVAKYISFFAGSLLAALIILTVIDEDVLQVQHVIGAMTVLTIIITICRACIPDEHIVWCPELLMRKVLAQIHYIPDSWKGNAHTYKVRDAFAQLFQYKVAFLVEELVSPLATPLILIFSIRHKSLEIVDFYRNFTVSVTGVGDVCSFAQMDVRKHGNPQWVNDSQTEANQYQQAEDGKTELSLMHFTLTNPEWKPPETGNHFIHNLKTQAQRDATTLSMLPVDNPLTNSLHSLSSHGLGLGYNSVITSLVHQSTAAPTLHGNYQAPGPSQLSPASSRSMISPTGHQTTSLTSFPKPGGTSTTASIRGGLRHAEGPIGGATNGLLASVQAANGVANSSLGLRPPPSLNPDVISQRGVDEETLEMLSTEMSFSALYMHELHRRRLHQPYYDNLEDLHARAIWEHGEDQHSPADEGNIPARPNMPEIQESILEDEYERENELEHEPLVQFVSTESISDRTGSKSNTTSSTST